MTLALLLTAATGAWAEEVTVTWKSGDTYENQNSKDGVTMVSEGTIQWTGSEWKLPSYSSSGTFTVERGVITKIEITGGYIDGFSGTGWSGRTWTGKAAEVPFNGFLTSDYDEKPWTITFTIDVPDVEVAWDAATNTGTFDMIASDVVLTPLYAPTAAWAEVETMKQLPAAAEGVIAGTDAPLIVEGTVATGQGTVMYFATTEQLTAEQAAQANGWLSTLPTAEGYDDATTVYVWYYIKGADTPDGQEATDKNTFNDSEICAQPLEVSVLSNKFDITFNAANDNTIEAGKATVKVGDAAATVTEGKLKAVKMGSTVTIKAKEGYKFRKVEAKKKAAAAAKTITIGDMELTYADGDTWETIVSKNSDKIKTLSGRNIVQVAQPASNQYRYIHVWYTAVKPSDIIDPSKYYQWGTMEVAW